MSKRIALYYRVSTDDQTTEPQRLELHDYCNRRGWPIAAEYSDTASGAKFTRSGLDGLMKAVRKRRIDVILCVKLDRLAVPFRTWRKSFLNWTAMAWRSLFFAVH